jgi:protein-tyrosine phosphatase
VPAETFEVVFVCTGNRFRSPLAAAIFRQAVAPLPVEVSSLGTLDLRTEGALPEAVALGREWGVDLREHRSAVLREADLSQVDLVIGFEHAHVIAAAMEGRSRRERTFTLPELVSLLERVGRPVADDALDTGQRRLDLAAGLRPTDPLQIGQPELEDPLGLPATGQRRIAEVIDDLTRRLAESLFGLERDGM